MKDFDINEQTPPPQPTLLTCGTWAQRPGMKPGERFLMSLSDDCAIRFSADELTVLELKKIEHMD